LSLLLHIAIVRLGSCFVKGIKSSIWMMTIHD
jgi:hypothetical protein